MILIEVNDHQARLSGSSRRLTTHNVVHAFSQARGNVRTVPVESADLLLKSRLGPTLAPAVRANKSPAGLTRREKAQTSEPS